MKQFFRTTLAAAVAVGLAVSMNVSALDKLTTDKEKVSYMIGMDMAQGLAQVKDEIDLNVLFEAVRTQVAGGKMLMTAEESQAVRTEFMNKMRTQQEAKSRVLAEKNKKEGDEYLAANKGKPGFTTTASGLQYKVLTTGKGKKPLATSQVRVHYSGTLIDGTKFDSSYDRGAPAEFAVNGVIAGWTEALQLMNEGSKWQLVIPSTLAYGDTARPGPIGPNATLLFDVELIAVDPAPAPAAAPAAEVAPK
ncbi:MAG: FKBP-type peptidyl-prolyl cis-trans isomerase [Pseudomonadota bacterium]|nr:FKBP-type peptidyl-prolyl cis-trans isomerase [Pseudomonadota bacterium]